jgi:hypothetical protein
LLGTSNTSKFFEVLIDFETGKAIVEMVATEDVLADFRAADRVIIRPRSWSSTVSMQGLFMNKKVSIKIIYPLQFQFFYIFINKNMKTQEEKDAIMEYRRTGIPPVWPYEELDFDNVGGILPEDED